MMEIIELFFHNSTHVLEVETQQEVPYPSLSIDFVQRMKPFGFALQQTSPDVTHTFTPTNEI